MYGVFKAEFQMSEKLQTGDPCTSLQCDGSHNNVGDEFDDDTGFP